MGPTRNGRMLDVARLRLLMLLNPPKTPIRSSQSRRWHSSSKPFAQIVSIPFSDSKTLPGFHQKTLLSISPFVKISFLGFLLLLLLSSLDEFHPYQLKKSSHMSPTMQSRPNQNPPSLQNRLKSIPKRMARRRGRRNPSIFSSKKRSV